MKKITKILCDGETVAKTVWESNEKITDEKMENAVILDIFFRGHEHKEKLLFWLTLLDKSEEFTNDIIENFRSTLTIVTEKIHDS